MFHSSFSDYNTGKCNKQDKNYTVFEKKNAAYLETEKKVLSTFVKKIIFRIFTKKLKNERY